MISSHVTPTPTASPSLSDQCSIGCPRKRPVWDYFVFDSSKDKSECQISREGPTEFEKCGHTVPNEFKTTLEKTLSIGVSTNSEEE